MAFQTWTPREDTEVPHRRVSSLWTWSSVEFMLENSTTKFEFFPPNVYNVLSKFAVFCWAVFIAIWGCMRP